MGLLLRKVKSDALRSIDFRTKHINSFLKHKIRERQTNAFPTRRIRSPSNRFTSIEFLTNKGIPKLGDFKCRLKVGDMLDFRPQINVINVDAT